MLRAMLFTVAVLSCGSAATAGLRDECLGLIGIAGDDIGILTCTAAIRENDQDAELYVARGRLYSEWRDYDRAIADFIKAGELGAKDDKLAERLGDAYLQIGEHDKAIALFDDAVQRNPKSIYALTRRGDAYRRKGDLNRALSDLNTSISHLSAYLSAQQPRDYFPEEFASTNPYYHRGLVHTALQQPERAVADFTDAISLGGGDTVWQTPLILNHRGEAHLKMGALADALADADKATELDAKNASHFELRARVREAMGQKAEAIQDYRRALSIAPKHMSSLEGLKRLGASP